VPSSASIDNLVRGYVMPPPTDPYLLDTCCDVVVRFKGHGSYGGEQAALKALRRRAPGSSQEEYRAAFDVLCKAYDRAVEAIRRHPAERPGGQRPYAEYDDIDFDACMRELEEVEPGAAMKQKRDILNWVIFWHYLK
jgi:hypothetical protein